ncbi:MAG: hypothetical protein IPH62_18220 [Ignavibacteriae bacterium]|nr:hypothetical protein [Ignavibacteriota bacterium]
MQTANVEIKIKLVKSEVFQFTNYDTETGKVIYSDETNFFRKRNILVNYNNRVIQKNIIKNESKSNIFDVLKRSSKFINENKNSLIRNNSDKNYDSKYFSNLNIDEFSKYKPGEENINSQKNFTITVVY